MLKDLLLTTDTIAAAERVDWWQDRTASLFGAEYRVEPEKHRLFGINMEIDMAPAAPLVLVKGAGTAHLSARPEGGSGAPNIVAHLQLQGRCTVRAEGREALIGPGDPVIHRVGVANSLHFHEDYRQICMVVPESMLAPAITDWSGLVGVAMPTEVGAPAVFAEHLRALVAHPGIFHGPGSEDLPFLTTGLLRAALCSRQPGHTSQSPGLRAYHLERVKQYALAHLRHPALHIDVIATGVKLSPRYIHRLFEDEPLSLMNWVKKERLVRAREQLEQPGCRLSICKVAHAWGFSDQAHFSRSFRKHFGMSPCEVRAG